VDHNDDSAESADQAAPDEIKDQMRAALDKKHAREHEGQDHLDGRAKAQGTHGQSGGARQFRRKSG
jgi:hypothetical protein